MAGGVVEVDPPVLLEKYVLDPKYKTVLVGTATYDIGGPEKIFVICMQTSLGFILLIIFRFPLIFIIKVIWLHRWGNMTGLLIKEEVGLPFISIILGLGFGLWM